MLRALWDTQGVLFVHAKYWRVENYPRTNRNHRVRWGGKLPRPTSLGATWQISSNHCFSPVWSCFEAFSQKYRALEKQRVHLIHRTRYREVRTYPYFENSIDSGWPTHSWVSQTRVCVKVQICRSDWAPPSPGPPLTHQQIWDFSTPPSTKNFMTDRRWNMSYILHPDQLTGTGKPSQTDLDFENLLSERLRFPPRSAERILELSKILILGFQFFS